MSVNKAVKDVVEDLKATIEDLRKRGDDARNNGGGEEVIDDLISKLEDITIRLEPYAVVPGDPIPQDWFSNTSN